MDNKVAAILLASLLERIRCDGGTSTVSSQEIQALYCALLSLDPDVAPLQ